MRIIMNDKNNDFLNEATAQFLESIMEYFSNRRQIGDVEWEVVYDLKQEVVSSLECLGFEIYNAEAWEEFHKLGGELYLDWRVSDLTTHEKLRKLNLRDNFEALKAGFIEMRNLHHTPNPEDEDDSNIECFYSAMDEVGIDYWT